MAQSYEERGWNTVNEINHINYAAAGGNESQRMRGISPEILIRGWLEGAKLRTRWGDVDRDEVIAHAQSLL